MRIVAGFGGASLLVSAFTWRRQRVGFADVARGRGPADLRKLAALETEGEAGREGGEVEAVGMSALGAGSQRPDIICAESEPSRTDDINREIHI